MLSRVTATALVIAVAATSSASAGQLVYQPTNPSFGGNPLNGSWLLGQAQAQIQGEGGGSGSGFVIDFPDFGNIAQPTTPTDPQTQPDVPVTTPTVPGL